MEGVMHSPFPDAAYFNEILQTSRNRLAPDRVWVSHRDSIQNLPEVTTSHPPMMLGHFRTLDAEYCTALNVQVGAIVAFPFRDFSPKIALRIASREWWEECFGARWWQADTLVDIRISLNNQMAKVPEFCPKIALKRGSWRVDEVQDLAVLFDIEAHRFRDRPPDPDDLSPIGYGEFMDTPYRQPEFILAPWLTSPGLAMIFAERGVGKTMMTSNIAFAVATGKGFLCWTCPQPKRVLIIDGEMPAGELQKRFREIERVAGVRPAPENLTFLTADLESEGLPDLGTIDGQLRFEKYLTGYDLIIVDNLSTLNRTGAENEADSWGVVQQWLIKQRSAGRCVLLVHHAGKGGAQRGTSRREDVLGTVIQLKHPAGYNSSEGANFEIHFTKARGFFGADAEPIEAHLGLDGIWTWKRLNEAKAEDAVALYQSGKNMREIAIELGVSASTVSGYIKAAGIPTKAGRPPKNTRDN